MHTIGFQMSRKIFSGWAALKSFIFQILPGIKRLFQEQVNNWTYAFSQFLKRSLSIEASLFISVP